ncbi:MAG: hypothetical protein RDV48_02430 [Candidatus Eremiobacteraeota bacterium]|nr:hypothetical protein [Candidatus Eremiobacteraeota bacterium]
MASAICVLDVADSRVDWNRVVYEKLPEFIEKSRGPGSPVPSFAPQASEAIDDHLAGKPSSVKICVFSQREDLYGALSRIALGDGNLMLIYYSYPGGTLITKTGCPFILIAGNSSFCLSLRNPEMNRFKAERIAAGELVSLVQRQFHLVLMEECHWQQWSRHVGLTEKGEVFEDPRALVENMLESVSLHESERPLLPAPRKKAPIGEQPGRASISGSLPAHQRKRLEGPPQSH